MKFTMFIARSVAALALSCAMAIALSGSEARAVTLLTVDVTKPGAVVFTGTGAFAETDTSVGVAAGFSLLDLFTGNATFGGPVASSTLLVGVNVVPVEYFYGNDVTYLNLYRGAGVSPAYDFATSAAAFTGVLILDLSSAAAFLPTAGVTGRIVIGDGYFGDAFGSWAVVSSDVPLPAALPLLLAGIAGLGALRLRRRA